MNQTAFRKSILFEYKRILPEELESCLLKYGFSLLSCLSEKQIVIDGKKQRGVSPTTRGNRGLYLLNVWITMKLV